LRRTSVLFAVADALFLMVVGSASNSTMHLVHTLEWNFTTTIVLGMAAAMAVQTLLAILAAPVLGSIETMVPSMIVGMLSPMQLCAFELIGSHPTRIMGVLAGAAFALATFAALRIWGRRYSHALRRTFSAL
jgi:hypothetical protein